ncbi:response regulator [Mucilaginibacter myungsuensis]|uniref:Response regulator transcription factor n=1 Tax=Mucilaginibacter myungsuensis TaxID=649104 RepID=A0A929KWJ1_9SPHI|nr:response regulator [Mucilaginibacter myungsuensis]MBE9662934.1 response regulator transcription factor [Mucilaginibacter myungsuensis]MDN3598555.1 response regulator [Mucilaginibacter myungsuensis]
MIIAIFSSCWIRRWWLSRDDVYVFEFKRLTFIANYRILEKKRVLIIENDQDIRQIVTYILDNQGFETLSIPEPQEISELITFNADLILLDEFINNHYGHRLCRKIKQTPALAAIPVIILSTANDIELIATECEANDYVRKPFDLEDMIGKVVQLVNHQAVG